MGLGEFFRKTFTALGGEVVTGQKYADADTDFRAQLTAIRAAEPDAIFLPGCYVAVGRVARRAPAATKDFAGVTGRTTINAQRDADNDAAIITVRGGRLTFVETIRP